MLRCSMKYSAYNKLSNITKPSLCFNFSDGQCGISDWCKDSVCILTQLHAGFWTLESSWMGHIKSNVILAVSRSRGFATLRSTYGASSVGTDGTQSGWLTDDGAKLEKNVSDSCCIDWRTADFEPGDVLVLHQDLLHMTACNSSDNYRISCDTRWQPWGHNANPKLGGWSEIG